MKRTLSLLLLLCTVLLAGCAHHARIQTAPVAHPNESWVIAETQRFATVLGVSVRAVITTTPYMVPASKPNFPGEKVPAAGRYVNGHIEYYRPVIQERDQAYGTALAAHETCHVKFHSEQAADDCARVVMGGE